MNTIDWSNIYNKHKGKWVALKDDEKTVIAIGDKIKDVIAVSEKEGFDSPILLKVPKKSVPFIG